MLTPNSSQHRVLIVESVLEKRLARSRLLQSKYLVREANNGQSAWEILLLDPSIHSVVVNLELDDQASIELVQKIRSSKIRRVRTIPILIVIPAPQDAHNIDAATDLAIKAVLQAGANGIVYEISSETELQAQVQTQIEAAFTQKALEEARETAARTATLDPITHLPTPHFLDMQLEISWSFAKRHKSNLAVLYIRIDRHHLGELAHNTRWFIKLENGLSELLQKTIRKEDVIARTAEGEFCVVAIGISQEVANHFAIRISKAIAQSPVQTPDGSTHISLSIGVSTLQDDDPNSIFELRSLARERVENAQKQGGNCVLSLSSTSNNAPTAQTPEKPETNVAVVTSPQTHPQSNPQSNTPIPPITLDQALELIRQQQIDQVIPHLHELQQTLHPLLIMFKQFDMLP